jgi:hypothetical protein
VQAELQHLSGDPRVSPARILARQAQHERSHAIVESRTAWTSPRLRPFASNQLPVPAQECLRRHDQPLLTPTREHTRERRDERSIGRPQRGTTGLPAEHSKLMSQHDQLDVFGEVAAPASDRQPQNSRKAR